MAVQAREFVRGLAKPSFTALDFIPMSRRVVIELAFKHVLGRPPLSQSEVSDRIDQQAREGFEAVIDSLVDSAEYRSLRFRHCCMSVPSRQPLECQ